MRRDRLTRQKVTRLSKSSKKTILLYGRTRSGKSTQIGEVAEFVHSTTGGKRTRLYTADKGGFDPVRPYVDLGIIEVVEMGDTDPWIFLNKAVRGYVRDPVHQKWILADNSNIGMYAFESMTAFADALMTSMAQMAAKNVNIGGGSNISFSVSGDDETLKVSGNNMAHFGVCQNKITEEVWQSQRLDAPYIMWTASVSKDDDLTASGKVLGPAVIGKALTHEVPRWFNLTFRIDAVPAQGGKGERHILYLGNHVDQNAGNAVGLGNTRVPMDATALPPTIEPASVVGALRLIERSNDQALEVIRRRMKLT